MRRYFTASISKILCIVTLCGIFSAQALSEEGDASPRNLAMKSEGAQIKSWITGVPIIPGYEPEKANDGSFRSFWTVPAHNLPTDLGVEWPEPKEISALILRFATAQSLPIINSARTQQFVRLQYWADGKWKRLKPQVSRGGTTILRFDFPMVNTTRIRAIFPEIYYFLDRIAPDQAGYNVSELEVYRKPPYQCVPANTGLAEVQGGDSLTIEPQQTRVFSDTLRPTLIVAESRWAKEPCQVISSSPGGTSSLENGFLQLIISPEKSLKEIRLANRVTQESVTTDRSTAFLLHTTAGDLTPDQFQVAKTEVVSAGPETAELRVDLTSPNVDVAVHYQLGRKDHFCHKWLTLKNKGSADLQVLDITLSSLKLPTPASLPMGPHGQDLSYPVTTLKQGGFFSCIETVHWDHVADALTYYPAETLKPGGTYETEKAVVGVFQNLGKFWLGMDQGVREWIIEYHKHISRFTDQWPFVYCEGWAANFGLAQSTPEEIERKMANAEKMGIRNMDGFEPMRVAMEVYPEKVGDWVEAADRHRINTGFWIDWGSRRPYGAKKAFMPPPCKLAPDFKAYLQAHLDFVKKNHLRSFHWGDFLHIYPCDNPDHGHLTGKYSIYAQGKRVIKFGEQLREASPGVVLNADQGWINPQYARYVDQGQHIDAFDHRPAAAPDIHLDRLYASMNRRYQFVHNGLFLHSWTRNLNCVNHFGHESHSQDRAGFRFGLLSALSFNASVTFNDFPDEVADDDAAFSRRWLDWARTNKDYLKETDILFDRTFDWQEDTFRGNPETLCGTAHLRKNRGYVFLTNYAPLDQIVELDIALDAPADTRFAVQEVYPGGIALQGPADGLYPQGGKLRVTVPGYQVRILWIAPATAAPGKVEREDARAGNYQRYIGRWTIGEKNAKAAVLKAKFQYPANAGGCLAQSVPEAQWQKEPWAFNKAYLVLHLKDESRNPNDLWVSDALFNAKDLTGVRINGVSKPVVAYKTKRNQDECGHAGQTRCFFVELAQETKVGAPNDIEIAVPVVAGLTFGGAYLDLPDQMPRGVETTKMTAGERR
jgi:hypothetical protein